jgi:hypothetical protein
VRDLGSLDIEQIKEVFRRINSMSYSLNAMEIENTRYDGEFKGLADELAQSSIFEDAKLFSPTEIRRMLDMRFVLSLTVTMMSQYFNRDEEIEPYLKRYNDEFPEYDAIRRRFKCSRILYSRLPIGALVALLEESGFLHGVCRARLPIEH